MLLTRAGLSPVMIGRSRELDALVNLTRGLRKDQTAPPVAIVSGEAGIGKTRLLREAAAASDAEFVLAGQAHGGDTTRPYGLLREALEPELRLRPHLPESLELREHAGRHVLGPLVDGHHTDGSHEHTNEELLLAAVDCVRVAVADRRALLLFEDLHWADGESLALFTRLATTAGIPVALIGTFRPEEFDRRHPLAVALDELERTRTVVHLPLGNLSEAEVGMMVQAVCQRPLDPTVVAALHARTQGNPFFIEELLASGAEPEQLAKAPLPWNAAEAVLRRVDDLGEDERGVLETAALLEARIRFDLLAATTELDERPLIRILRRLVERGLLTETEPDVFAFRHALTREAVGHQLLGRERRRIHEAALEALKRLGIDDPAMLARHAAGAGRASELADYGKQAAERMLMQGATGPALKFAELALSRATEDVPATALLRLRTLATHAAYELGLYDAAALHAEEWYRLADERQAAAKRSAALRALASARRYQGRQAESLRLLDQALDIATTLGPSQELAWCQSYRSQAYMLAHRNEEAVHWADLAVQMAKEVGSPQVRRHAMVNKGSALAQMRGRETEGLELLDAAAHEARDRGDTSTTLRAWNNALVYLVHSDMPLTARVRGMLADARELAARSGGRPDRLKFSALAMDFAFIDGDAHALQAARAEAWRYAATYDENLLFIELAACRLAAEDGDIDAALEGLAREEQRLAAILERGESEQLPDDEIMSVKPTALWASEKLYVARSVVHARAGNAGEVASSVTALIELSQRDPNPHLPRRRVDALLAAATVGLPKERLDELASAIGVESASPPAAHVRSILAARAGDHDTALAEYRRAADATEHTQPAWMIADALLGAARCAEILGHRTQAIDYAEQARERLDRWPGWRRDDADALLRRLRGQQGDGPLTVREREVLVLLTEGLTNREIAERLFITRKTAAVHVSNILAKTGLSSRTEAAAWALRTGIVDPAATS